MADPTSDDEIDALAEALGERLARSGSSIGVAESLTGGLLTNALARVSGSGAWLRGGVVAYASEVKHDLLRVRPGPVVSEGAAHDLAVNAARRLGAHVGIGVTGVGGPDPQDGEPPGTVWIAVATGDRPCEPVLHRLQGEPPDICRHAIVEALRAAIEALEARTAP